VAEFLRAGHRGVAEPGLSAFALPDGVVYHTYSSYAPESNFMVFLGPLLERTPKPRTTTSRRAVTTSTSSTA
jgi:predicted dithiol-disulfide oxidoreductase (DUF899 family)